MYEGGLKSSKADYDAMVVYDQILFFNIDSPVVHTLLPSVLEHLNSCGIVLSSHPESWSSKKSSREAQFRAGVQESSLARPRARNCASRDPLAYPKKKIAPVQVVV